MNVVIVAFAVLIVTAFPPHRVAQAARINQPDNESMILRRAAANVQRVEQEWRFLSTICNCPPLMHEQTGVASGIWDQPGTGTSIRTIAMRVHAITNVDAAARWIDRTIRENIVADGWRISRYEFGDGGYTATYRDGKQYEDTFRKGRYLGFVSGESEGDVHRFASYLLAAIPKSE